MSRPLLELTGVWRSYPAGDEPIHALKNVDLTIYAGEMVAIMGQSGSGKSTLMNILGCLDRPSKGTYKVDGTDVRKLWPDQLAALRREHFGFIFQRYHLLADLDARANVEVPAVYSGRPLKERRRRAGELLARLGLSDRMGHRPNELSGGQQQRVSVARALMNGGEVILADEPTGALDTKSGAEMMKILRELNAEGHTIILVTHDPKVAQHARRIIEISDGEIIADYVNPEAGAAPEPKELGIDLGKEAWSANIDRLGEALRMALLAMKAHRLRTALTMLGIIIGIMSVVTIFAIGAGARHSILAELEGLGSNTIFISPGSGPGDMFAGRVETLRPSDMEAIRKLSYVDSASPQIGTGGPFIAGGITGNGSVTGVGDEFFRVQNLKFDSGGPFGSDSVDKAAQEIVIDHFTANKLFPNGQAVGKVVLMAGVPARVVGVTAKPEGLASLMQFSNLQAYAPYTMVMARMVSRPSLDGIMVRLEPGVSTAPAEQAITRVLTSRHGRKDFSLQSTETMRAQINTITGILSVVLGSIGGISLLVGGIGVMNIMLVSVSERTREIGVRTAVGARRSDIRSQFVIEAVLVCLIGGAIGVLLALTIGWVFGLFVKSFTLVYSGVSIIAAFGTATLIGLIFGWLPAHNAAKLDPVIALARE